MTATAMIVGILPMAIGLGEGGEAERAAPAAPLHGGLIFPGTCATITLRAVPVRLAGAAKKHSEFETEPAALRSLLFYVPAE